jgi:hypothetical protein
MRGCRHTLARRAELWFQIFFRERASSWATGLRSSMPRGRIPATAVPSPTAVGGDGGGKPGSRWSSSRRWGAWWWATGGEKMAEYHHIWG